MSALTTPVGDDPYKITYKLDGAGKKGRGKRTGFRDTHDYQVLIQDAAAMIKLHLPGIEQFQADELARDLVMGVIESKYL